MACSNHSGVGQGGVCGHSGILESWKTVASDTIPSAAGESFTGFLGQFPVATLVSEEEKGHIEARGEARELGVGGSGTSGAAGGSSTGAASLRPGRA